MSEAPTDEIRRRIDAIEEAYEFFLAYAAQGATGDGASKSGGQLRHFLGRMVEALDGLDGSVRDAARGMAPGDAWEDLAGVVGRDAGAAHAAVRLVLAQPSISSQLVDNLNANIHLRAVLTDLFLVDELLG